MNTYKILIIEDDPVIKSELQILLSGNGYTVVTVEDFSSTVQTVEAEKPHLILLDIKLPRENGFSICSKIRAFSKLHLDSSKVEYNGKLVELTKNEQKILYYLFKHAGAICSRADLIDFLWDNQLYVDDNALSVNSWRSFCG